MVEAGSKKLADISLSVLDLATIIEGGSTADAFHNSLDLARKVESLDFKRFWVAEHHNMVSVASSATSVLIGYLAGGTSKIRVGSGGIMLPNHAPLIIAEQFGTLESLYPGRIDLGLGRAPGTDPVTAAALRRDQKAAEEFPREVLELQTYLSAENSTSSVRAIPGEGLDIPIYLLGSSTYSAQLAGMLGLPYAYASHFSPQNLKTALQIYRDTFRPSAQLKEPYVIAGVNVIAGETDKDAEFMVNSLYHLALGIIRGKRYPLQPPQKSLSGIWSAHEEEAVKHLLHFSFIGGPETIRDGLQNFLNETQVDELMVVSHMYDHQERLRSYEILEEVVRSNEKAEGRGQRA